jgi:hypothetical protein
MKSECASWCVGSGDCVGVRLVLRRMSRRQPSRPAVSSAEPAAVNRPDATTAPSRKR